MSGATLAGSQAEETASEGEAVLARVGWLLILVLAALPRLSHLNRFLIIDEPGRWEWAKQFFTAVVNRDLAGTMIHGYPGVLPDWFSFVWIGLNTLWRSWQEGSWLGEAGLYAMFHEWDRTAQHLADQRLGVVLGNTLLVLLAYLLIQRLFGLKIALVSGVLIALDPFYLTDSRVNRAEAVTAGVTFLSLLLFVLYIRESRWRWLMLSGMVAGLACLAKFQALLIWPIVGLIALVYWLTSQDIGSVPRRLWTWVAMMAVWSLSLIVAFWLAWPAMWVAPLDTLHMVYEYVTIQSGAEGVNLFFLGNVVRNSDPGPLFYPVAFALRSNPLVLLGLGAALWAWWQCRSRPLFPLQKEWLVDPSGLWVVTAFILLYPALMTLGSHKQDRYLLTIFPMVNLLAATGLIWLWERIRSRFRALKSVPFAGLGVLLVAQILLVLPYHPYYYPYFNPLTGGGYTAPHLIRIGWGEGLDEVADFLNSLPDPRRLIVASRFPRHLMGFEGTVLALDAGGEWTRADHIVFYIHQVQREQDPGPGEIRWLRRYSPEHVVRLSGIEYAWVYQNPISVPANPQISQVVDQLQLFGYIWEEAGSALRLVWLNQHPDSGGQMLVRLRNDQVVTPWFSCEPEPLFAEAAQTSGEVVESRCLLSDLPPLGTGLYDLEVGVRQSDGEVRMLSFPEGRASLGVRSDGALVHLSLEDALEVLSEAALPKSATPSGAIYGNRMRLAGYELTDSPLHPGEALQVDLYWQALAPLDTDYTAFVHLFDAEETRLAASDVQHATSQWLPGVVNLQRYELSLSAQSPAPAVARIDVGLYDEALHLLHPVSPDGQRLPWTLAQLKIVPDSWPSLDEVTPVQADFDSGTGHIRLAGYRLVPEAPHPGDLLTLTLYWQPQVVPSEDYTVFVHLLDAAGNIITQADGVPVDGRYPTSAWEAGESIIDSRPVQMPADLPGGEYTLIIGLYNSIDGSRLPLAEREADFFQLGQLRVNP